MINTTSIIDMSIGSSMKIHKKVKFLRSTYTDSKTFSVYNFKVLIFLFCNRYLNTQCLFHFLFSKTFIVRE